MEERNVGGLRCSEVLRDLSDFIDGSLSPDIVATIEAHLEGCPNCARFGASFAKMIQVLYTPRDSLPQSLAERLVALARDPTIDP